jgi:tetratricopeptide (TPR) repeat protein
VVAAYALTYLGIVLHEMGHYLAARAVGARVAALSFGGGRLAMILRIGEMFLIVSPVPTEGLIVTRFDTAEGFRKKSAAILGAGPLINLLGAAAGAYVLLATDIAHSHLSTGLWLLWTGYNAILGIANLWPFMTKTVYGPTASDGAQLLGLPSMADEDIQNTLRAQAVILAWLHYVRGDMSAALKLLEDELGLDDDIVPGSFATALLAETGQLERGIELARRRLARDHLEPTEHTMLQNNLASLLHHSGEAERLKEADRLSAAAIEMLPMMPAVRATRGAVLVATGRFEEGLDLLTDHRFRLETRELRANVDAVRALGLAELGRIAEAERALDNARSLDGSNRYLDTAEAAIASAPARGAVHT